MYIIRRSTHNPLIAPMNDRQWESQATFNPAAIKRGDVTYVLYRALGRPDALQSPGGLSTIGRAFTLDGKHFQDRRQLITPTEPWEMYGCEDPRVTFFEGQYVICYTALGGRPFGPGNIKVAMAFSKDLERVHEKHLVTPFNAKAMSIFPERINGKVTAIFSAHTDEPPTHIAIAQADRLEEFWDLGFWEKWHAGINDHIINPLRFEHDHVEAGATPIYTKDGWLVLYSYIQNYFGGGERVFGIEALLLDLHDPHQIVGKTKGPIMVPQEAYERYGMVPNIVFPSSAILEKSGRIDIYYGAADTVCARASLNLDDLLNAMIPERRAELAKRVPENPILKPIGDHPWESKAVFNPAAIDIDGTIHLLYRAMGNDRVSVLGYAATKNGVKITERLAEPAYVPREDFEKKKGDGGGCEDPRVTRMGNTIYLAYTAYNGVDPWRSAMSSISVKDFVAHKWDKWEKPQLVTPAKVQDKDTCILPEKVGGKYMVMHRIDPMICADLVDSLDFTKTPVTRCIEIMGPRPGMWDSVKIGIAGPPIKTAKGWLLLYHGVSKTGTYRLGAVLLDLKNPSIIHSRTVDTILEPLDLYERTGYVHNAVFSCGAVLRGKVLLVYYGGSDTVIGVAKVSVEKLLKILLPDNVF